MAIYRYNPGTLPPVTLGLVILNVLVAIGDLAMNGWFERTLWARGIDIYYGELWRIPGCTIVHANLMHLAFNAYGIWILGKLFEQLQGWRAMLTVYVVSALGGAALGVAFNDPHTPMLGASGAAYGLMGAVLGFFYVKTGSLRGLWENPISRQLTVWFLIGIYVSTLPGISLLGHLGGFVPGVLLGVFYEYRYERRLDLFHKLALGAMLATVLLFCLYAAFPWHRGEYIAVRALRAYEKGQIARGDELLHQAQQRGAREGGQKLIRHLQLLRAESTRHAGKIDPDALRLPLTTTEPGQDGKPRDPTFVVAIDGVEGPAP